MPRHRTSMSRMKTVCIVVTVMTLTSALEDKLITITDNHCDKAYDPGWYDNLYLEYSPSRASSENQCKVELENEDSTDMLICISVEDFTPDCKTVVEYHESYVKTYYPADKTVNCYDTSEDWCSDKYKQTVFIVFNPSGRSSSGRIKLRVYRKYFTTSSERFFKSGINIFLVAMSPAVLISIIMCIACYFCIRNKRRDALARQARFQTTMETVTLQAGQNYGTPVQQPSAGYQPVLQTDQEQTGLNIPAGYNVHPMQRCTPVDQGAGQAVPNFPQPQSPSSGNVPYRPQPSAPTMNSEAPPPSYDSLWK